MMNPLPNDEIIIDNILTNNIEYFDYDQNFVMYVWKTLYNYAKDAGVGLRKGATPYMVFSPDIIKKLKVLDSLNPLGDVYFSELKEEYGNKPTAEQIILFYGTIKESEAKVQEIKHLDKNNRPCETPCNLYDVNGNIKPNPFTQQPHEYDPRIKDLDYSCKCILKDILVNNQEVLSDCEERNCNREKNNCIIS